MKRIRHGRKWIFGMMLKHPSAWSRTEKESSLAGPRKGF